jgi:hypothetical protein
MWEFQDARTNDWAKSHHVMCIGSKSRRKKGDVRNQSDGDDEEEEEYLVLALLLLLTG